MIIADQPMVEAATTTSSVVAMTQVSDGLRLDSSRPHIIGVCTVVTMDRGYGQSSVFPLTWASSYLAEHGVTGDIDYDKVEVRMIQAPKHGKLVGVDDVGSFTDKITDWVSTVYLPKSGYKGSDSVVMRVTVNGYTVDVHYFFAVGGDKITDNPNCKDENTLVWDIASTLPKGLDSSDL
ncbi:MAG: hypothetical protein ABUL58_02585 [Steroidobacter sp.]